MGRVCAGHPSALGHLVRSHRAVARAAGHAWVSVTDKCVSFYPCFQYGATIWEKKRGDVLCSPECRGAGAGVREGSGYKSRTKMNFDFFQALAWYGENRLFRITETSAFRTGRKSQCNLAQSLPYTEVDQGAKDREWVLGVTRLCQLRLKLRSSESLIDSSPGPLTHVLATKGRAGPSIPEMRRCVGAQETWVGPEVGGRWGRCWRQLFWGQWA